MADLPVGKNLQDHTWTDAGFFETPKPISLTEARATSLVSTLKYFTLGQGIVYIHYYFCDNLVYSDLKWAMVSRKGNNLFLVLESTATIV